MFLCLSIAFPFVTLLSHANLGLKYEIFFMLSAVAKWKAEQLADALANPKEKKKYFNMPKGNVNTYQPSRNKNPRVNKNPP